MSSRSVIIYFMFEFIINKEVGVIVELGFEQLQGMSAHKSSLVREYHFYF